MRALASLGIRSSAVLAARGAPARRHPPPASALNGAGAAARSSPRSLDTTGFDTLDARHGQHGGDRQTATIVLVRARGRTTSADARAGLGHLRGRARRTSSSCPRRCAVWGWGRRTEDQRPLTLVSGRSPLRSSSAAPRGCGPRGGACSRRPSRGARGGRRPLGHLMDAPAARGRVAPWQGHLSDEQGNLPPVDGGDQAARRQRRAREGWRGLSIRSRMPTRTRGQRRLVARTSANSAATPATPAAGGRDRAPVRQRHRDRQRAMHARAAACHALLTTRPPARVGATTINIDRPSKVAACSTAPSRCDLRCDAVEQLPSAVRPLALPSAEDDGDLHLGVLLEEASHLIQLPRRSRACRIFCRSRTSLTATRTWLRRAKSPFRSAS